MTMQSNRPYYKLPSIGSIDTLANVLSVKKQNLLKIAGNANSLYRLAKKIPKTDGTTRYVYDAKPPLKSLQAKIKSRILKNVFYPKYLQGGISDPASPRSYISNAALHSRSKVLINEDIKSFFPTFQSKYVYQIWKYLFHFPDDVATVLTTLTTKEGFLVQGASTSSYLANLAFFDEEPQLYEKFKSQKIKYSRFIDDTSTSSNSNIQNKVKAELLASLFGMMAKKSLKINRSKHCIATSSQRMAVHRLNLNSNQPTMPKKKRYAIRAAVYQCEKMYSDQANSEKYKQLYNKTSGRVAEVSKLHPKLGKALRTRLRKITPKTATPEIFFTYATKKHKNEDLQNLSNLPPF